MKVDASKAIQPEQLESALSEVLTDWYDHGEKRFFQSIDEAADACNDEIALHVPKKTGDYRNSFAISKGYRDKHDYKAEWYVRAPEYRLTHLLENGHLTRDGVSRSKAVPHIKYGRQIAEKVLQEKLSGLWG